MLQSVTIILLCGSILLSLLRLLLGPTTADRVVALDVMTIISIGLITVIASLLERAVYIDAAMVYGLISFIGVISFARYLERGL
jgi:multicomponent Na+:H+ antiporter subunit F